MKTATILILAGLFGMCLFVAGCELVPSRQATDADSGELLYTDLDGKATTDAVNPATNEPNQPLMLHDVEKVENLIRVTEEAGGSIPIIGDWWKLAVGAVLSPLALGALRRANASRLAKAGVKDKVAASGATA